MDVLAVTPTYTLPFLRRVMAPFAALAARGRSWSYMTTPSFIEGLSFSTRVLVLQDWELSDQEFDEYTRAAATHERMIVFDLSEPALLSSERIRATLACADLVTVPTPWLAREVAPLCQKIAVIDSCLDPNYFYECNRWPKPDIPSIGCFGLCEWGEILPVLRTVKEKRPDVNIFAGPEAQAVFPDTLGAIVVPYDVQHYHKAIFGCALGLLPHTHPQMLDPIWSYEYWLLGKPTYHGFDLSLVETMLERLRSPQDKDQKQMHWKRANAARASVHADDYLLTYRKKLPTAVL